MAAPSTPTSFIADSRARPWFQSSGGGVANYDGVKLTWSHTGTFIRLQILQGGVWSDLAQGSQTGTYLCRSLTSTSAEIIGIIGGASFRVAAGNSDGISGWAATVVLAASSVVPTVASLATPVATLTTNSTSALTISWTDTTNDESFFEVELRNALTGAVRTYQLPTFARTFSRAPGADGVLASTPYIARVRAVSEQIAPTRINGAWSNDLVFTTLAPVIVLTQLPASVDWWRNAPAGSYTIVTNTPPTSISTAALPAGLSHASGIITGVATAAVGSYAVNITAINASSSDTKALTFNVREPALALRFSTPGGPQFDAIAANANAIGTGALGVLKEIEVRGVVTGPVSSAFTSLAITGAPAWLDVDGSSIKGTPNIPGDWDVNITAENDTGQTVTETLRFSVPVLAFTSASSLTVFEQGAVSFPISTSPAATTLELTGAPDWLTLADGVLTGIASEAAQYTPTLTAILGGSSAVQAFTLNVQSAIAAPSEIIGHIGDPMIDAATYLGASAVEAWHISGMPGGVTFSPIAIEGEQPALSIAGTPTEFGIFEAVISAQIRTATDVRMIRRPVTFRISGGLFFYWFHDEPSRRELQVFMRTGEVRSLAETTAATLTIKRGDPFRLYIIFRDGPFGPGRIGRDVIDGVTNVSLIVRPDADFDGEPYITLPASYDSRPFTSGGDNLLHTESDYGFEIGDTVRVSTTDTLPAGLVADTDYFVSSFVGRSAFKISAARGGAEHPVTDGGTGIHRIRASLATEVFDGKTIIYLPMRGTSDAIEAVFKSLNRSPRSNPAAAALLGTGEISCTINGDAFSSKSFRVIIEQDINR